MQYIRPNFVSEDVIKLKAKLRTQNKVLYTAYRIDQTAMLYTLYYLLLTAFLLLSTILYFMHMRITPGKAHV